MKGEVVIMIKRIIAILIAVILLFSLVGCGARKKVDQKIQEKVMEKTVDKITGDNVDIDTDKDKITIKGKDGNEEFTFGDSKWPEGKAADLIPKFKKGNIVSVMNADSACVIMIENVQENDFKQYMEEVKKAIFFWGMFYGTQKNKIYWPVLLGQVVLILKAEGLISSKEKLTI
jgi:predicted small lipoprotein YifL